MRSCTLHGLLAVAIGMVLYLTCAVYRPGLHGPLFFDDLAHIFPLTRLDVADSPQWLGYSTTSSGPLGRPVSMATFVLNGLASGNSIFQWKATNLALHLINGLLWIWLTARLIAVAERNRIGEDARWVAAIGLGGLWLLHPMMVSTVLYTVQRMTELASLFSIAGMLFYVIGRERQESGKSGAVALLSVYMVFFPLAVASKENGILLPLYCWLIEMIVFRTNQRVVGRWRNNALHILFLWLPFVIGSLWVLWRFDSVIALPYQKRDFSLPERLLTEARVVVFYATQIVMPDLWKLGFFHDDLRISTGLLKPPTTLLSLLVLCGLSWITLRLRKSAPLVSLGLGLFLAGHLVESTILPLELLYEHRNYLPGFGVIAAVGFTFMRLLPGVLPAVTAIVFAMVVLVPMTKAHSEYWSRSDRLLEYVYRSHPGSGRARAQVAGMMIGASRYADGLEVLMDRDTLGASLQRAYIYCRRDNRLPDRYFQAALENRSLKFTDTYVGTGIVELGKNGLDKRCEFSKEGFLSLVDYALARPTTDKATRANLLIYKAHYHWEMREQDTALATLEGVDRLTGGDPVTVFLRTEWMISLGKMEAARSELDRAIGISRETGRDYSEYIDRAKRMLRDPELARHWLR